MSLIKRPALLSGVAFGLAALTLLTGCASTPKPVAGARVDAPTPLDKFQVKTRDVPDQVGLTIHADGLSPAQRDALAAFAERWKRAGGGAVTLQVPSDAPDAEVARTFVMAAESTLAVLGVPYERIRASSYVQGASPKPLVLASFQTAVADGPDCASIGWENLTATKDNTVYKRFGCSLAANLAAEIADPRDLRGDTPLGPSDNMRRMQVLDAYRKGAITSSQKDSQANGAVSSVGAQ